MGGAAGRRDGARKIMNKNGAERLRFTGTKGRAGEGHGFGKGMELRDAITEQHKEQRGQLKDLLLSGPIHCQGPSPRVLSWPQMKEQGVFPLRAIGVEPSAPSKCTLAKQSHCWALTPGTAGINL